MISSHDVSLGYLSGSFLCQACAVWVGWIEPIITDDSQVDSQVKSARKVVGLAAITFVSIQFLIHIYVRP